MLKLKPRKRIDPDKVPQQTKPVPAYCAFCESRIPKPQVLPGPTAAEVGTCTDCGARYVSDGNGKLGGEALLVGLTLLANGDDNAAMSLREGVDYETRALAYDERTHEVDPSTDPRRYGVGRMWYFKHLPR